MTEGVGAWTRHSQSPSQSQSKLVSLSRSSIAILNKLTPTHFTVLSEQFNSLQIDNIDDLNLALDHIFNNALLDERFAQVYAFFCFSFDKYFPEKHSWIAEYEGEDPSNASAIRSCILSKCQVEFENLVELAEKANELRAQLEDPCLIEAYKNLLRIDLSTLEVPEARFANLLRFIGALYNRKVVPESFVHHLLNYFCASETTDHVLSFITLMTAVGFVLDKTANLLQMNDYFSYVSCRIDDIDYAQDVRVSLLALVELRQYRWVSRVECLIPKPISKKLNTAIIVAKPSKSLRDIMYDQLSWQTDLQLDDAVELLHLYGSHDYDSAFIVDSIQHALKMNTKIPLQVFVNLFRSGLVSRESFVKAFTGFVNQIEAHFVTYKHIFASIGFSLVHLNENGVLERIDFAQMLNPVAHESRKKLIDAISYFSSNQSNCAYCNEADREIVFIEIIDKWCKTTSNASLVHRIKSFGTSKYYSEFIEIFVDEIVMKPMLIKKASSLLVYLFESKTILADALEDGYASKLIHTNPSLTAVIATIEDRVIACPRIFNYVGAFLAHLVEFKVLNVKTLPQLYQSLSPILSARLVGFTCRQVQGNPGDQVFQTSLAEVGIKYLLPEDMPEGEFKEWCEVYGVAE